jgi:WD40 repeat protein
VKRAALCALAAFALVLPATAQVEKVATVTTEGPVRVALCPDGKELVGVTHDGKLHTWSVRDGKLRRTKPVSAENNGRISCAEESLAIGTRNGEVLILARADAGELARLRTASGEMDSVALAPDGLHLAVALQDDATQLFDARTVKVLNEVRSEFGGNSAGAFSPEGSLFAVAGEDNVIRIYHSDGRLKGSNDDSLLGIFTLLFTSDAKLLLAAGADRTVTFLDPQTGDKVRSLGPSHEPIGGMALSPDGRKLITFHFDDATARNRSTLLWDVESGKSSESPVGQRTLFGAPQVTKSATFFVTSGDQQGEIIIWSLK